MKVLFVKKTLLLVIVACVLVAIATGLNLAGVPVSATYLNVKTKLLPIYAVETSENKLAISFDAAWGADKTREIMAICDSYNVKATFFLVGFWIEKYPDMVKEIYNNGFEIGIHSMTHPDMRSLSRSEIKQELSNNMKMIEELTNYTPKLFRPPYGYYNNDLIEVCDELGLSCIEWSVDSLDWKGLSAGELSGRVIERATNGSIVLFHNNSDNIIEGLKMTLEHFKTQNMSVVPIGELIYYENFTINTQGIQIKN